MFKFDKYTRPYHIFNMVFYIFTLVVIALVYIYGFYPPIADVATEEFFANFGFGDFVGVLFFLILIITPLLVLYGAVYHFYKTITFNKGQNTAED